MSAPAAALAPREHRIVVVRLADSALLVGVLSLVFAALLVIYPVWFPNLIVKSWERGYLLPLTMVFTLLVDTCLYLRIAQRLSATPSMAAAACLGSLPLLVVGASGLLLQRSVKYTLLSCRTCMRRLGKRSLRTRFWELFPRYSCLSWRSGCCSRLNRDNQSACLTSASGISPA